MNSSSKPESGPERHRALRAFGTLAVLRMDGNHSEDEIAQKLGFGSVFRRSSKKPMKRSRIAASSSSSLSRGSSSDATKKADRKLRLPTALDLRTRVKVRPVVETQTSSNGRTGEGAEATCCGDIPR